MDAWPWSTIVVGFTLWVVCMSLGGGELAQWWYLLSLCGTTRCSSRVKANHKWFSWIDFLFNHFLYLYEYAMCAGGGLMTVQLSFSFPQTVHTEIDSLATQLVVTGALLSRLCIDVEPSNPPVLFLLSMAPQHTCPWWTLWFIHETIRSCCSTVEKSNGKLNQLQRMWENPNKQNSLDSSFNFPWPKSDWLGV